MTVLVVLLALIAVPIALLVWTRRGVGGERGSDPRANRDIGRHGGPPAGAWGPNDPAGPSA
jgi:hypothetical protein